MCGGITQETQGKSEEVLISAIREDPSILISTVRVLLDRDEQIRRSYEAALAYEEMEEGHAEARQGHRREGEDIDQTAKGTDGNILINCFGGSTECGRSTPIHHSGT